MEHPWGKEIQGSNKVSGVINDHAIKGDTFLYRFIGERYRPTGPRLFIWQNFTKAYNAMLQTKV